jgi:undecaprenyl-diphosphatase
MSTFAAAGRKYPSSPLAGFLLFAIIAFFVLNGSSHALDERLFLNFSEWARTHPGLMAVLTFMSAVAEPVFRISGAILLVIAMLVLRRPRAALFVFAATAGGAALCSLIKALAERARPDLLPRLDSFDSYSFPSGHAWNGMIFYGEIALVAALFLPRHWRIPVVALGVGCAFLTGAARVALGVHWPSDVLAGWIGGGAWLLFCYGLLLGGEVGRARTISTVDPH